MRKVLRKQDRREDGANSNNNNGSATLDTDDSVRAMSEMPGSDQFSCRFHPLAERSYRQTANSLASQ
jgi:hypothetical protein